MKKSFRKKFIRFAYDHIWLKRTFEYLFLTFASLISAIIFVIGFKTFLAPGSDLQTLVSGGASGLSQDISLIIQICFARDPLSQKTIDLIYSILYFLVNIPIIILALRGIGVRFGIFTLINVLMVSGLINFANIDFINKVMVDLAKFVSENGGGMLARALFAGICTGLSSAVAFKFDFSAGGIDVISYYFALRKSTSVGKYSMLLNSIIVVAFSVLNIINGSQLVDCIGGLFFTIEYIFVITLVVDSINVRNKKVQLQIITSLEMLPQLLMANVPHGATVIKGKGAYSGTDKWVIYMDISQSEVKKAVSIIKRLDPSSFVNVTNLQQVYGRFFVKTVK